jgi:hypothetical protein
VTITARATLLVTIIVLGLALRRFGPGLGIPASIVKYGGSILWGAMVFFLVAIARPRFSRWPAAAISAVIAVGVELFRLFHTPWLDEFRLTLAGAAGIRPNFFGVEYLRLWRGNSAGRSTRPLRRIDAGDRNASLAELKTLEAVQFLFDSPLQLLARALHGATYPIPFLQKQFFLLAVGLEIERGDDLVAHQNR